MNAKQRRSALKPYKREWEGARVLVTARRAYAEGIEGVVTEVRHSGASPRLMVKLDVAVPVGRRLESEFSFDIKDVAHATIINTTTEIKVITNG